MFTSSICQALLLRGEAVFWQVVAEMAAIGFGLPNDAFTSLMNLVQLFSCIAFLFIMHIAYFIIIVKVLPFAQYPILYIMHYLCSKIPVFIYDRPSCTEVYTSMH